MLKHKPSLYTGADPGFKVKGGGGAQYEIVVEIIEKFFQRGCNFSQKFKFQAKTE